MKLATSWIITPCLLAGPFASAQSAPKDGGSATVQVTATRFLEEASKVPASITVISGKELEDRGVTDLRSALALAAGISIAPGGDGGPASSVPEFWGLKEFDAFLLVVDGVPWGGAFNPSLATLDLHDVERIEVQRGAAPVMYGATSFVGVIHVIHRLPSESRGSAQLSAGNHESGSVALTLRLPSWAGFDSSLSSDYAKQGFVDPRTRFERGHLLWRNRMNLAEGSFHFDLDGTTLDQRPASPFPMGKSDFAGLTPRDANHNPSGAFMKEDRLALRAGYDRDLGSALWSTTLSASHSNQRIFKGFLNEEVDAEKPPTNANGCREPIQTTDLYFDTHLAWSKAQDIKVVLGLDHLHGTGSGRGGDFDYEANLDGSIQPGSDALPPAADIRIDDHRDFTGLYAFAEWEPHPRLVLEAGLRLNRAEESRHKTELDLESGDLVVGGTSTTTTRLSGSAGLSWTAWQRGADRVTLYGNYRNTFKPAAIDFGLDSEPDILKPETAQSYDLGLKATLLEGRLSTEVATFLMDFANLVTSQNNVLINSGKQRFQGVEVSALYRFSPDLVGRASYSNHDARFRDFAFEFDPGVPTQLAGKRLEMSPYHLAAMGLNYAPARGFVGSLEANYVGSVYLNKRNTVLAGSYATLAASLGYRGEGWELRVNGQNLTDRRNPVSESEMGDKQYYLLPGRQVGAFLRFRF